MRSRLPLSVLPSPCPPCPPSPTASPLSSLLFPQRPRLSSRREPYLVPSSSLSTLCKSPSATQRYPRLLCVHIHNDSTYIHILHPHPTSYPIPSIFHQKHQLPEKEARTNGPTLSLSRGADHPARVASTSNTYCSNIEWHHMYTTSTSTIIRCVITVLPYLAPPPHWAILTIPNTY